MTCQKQRIGASRPDLALGVALFAAGVADNLSVPLAPGVAVLLSVLTSLPLIVRRAYPVAVLVLVLVGITARTVMGADLEDGLAPVVTLAVAAYTVAAEGSPRRYPVAAAAAAVGLASAWWIDGERSLGNLAFGAVLLGAAATAGFVVRRDRALARRLRLLSEKLLAEQVARERAAAERERVAIARELHDIVAHTVAVIAVQAQAAQTVSGASMIGDRLRSIEASATSAIDELRRAVSLLRNDAQAGQASDLRPQPRISDLETLAASVRATGIDVRLVVRPPDRAPASSVEVSAYRIVQEALTNAVKHARADSVDVAVEAREAELIIRVRDNGDTATDPSPGHGLTGMRERVELFGGRFRAGPAAGHGWEVYAALPLTTSR